MTRACGCHEIRMIPAFWLKKANIGMRVGRFCGGVPEWPKGTDCKSVVYDFGGSNPPPPTTNMYQHRHMVRKRFGAGIAQLVEHQPSKLRVASSNLVSRSKCLKWGRLTRDGCPHGHKRCRVRPGEIRKLSGRGAKHNRGAHVAQLVELLHGKQVVSSSSLLVGSILRLIQVRKNGLGFTRL